MILVVALFGPRATSGLSPECAPKGTSAGAYGFTSSRPGQIGIRVLFAAVYDSGCGTFRTSRDVRLESGMRTKGDIRRRLWIYKFTPWSDRNKGAICCGV